LIINKSPWINVHPWDHKTTEISLINQAQDYLWDKLNSLTFKPSLIHRIDRDTSWIIMIAKKKDILTKLWEDFKKSWKWSKIKKTYLAYVFWNLPSETWTITKKLLRIEWAKNENKVQVSEKGLDAVTHYKVIWENTIKTKEWNIIISEVEINIDTWRMHQIRVHMADLWNPVVLDDKYWDKKLNSYIKRTFWLDRQALHSSKISFFHYGKNKNIELTANLKDDMKEFLEKVKKV
jgi:23S rRNA-/tRNA-specific pseudouridylate synthase